MWGDRGSREKGGGSKDGAPWGWWRGLEGTGGHWGRLEGTGGDWRGCPVWDPCWEMAAEHRGVGGVPRGNEQRLLRPPPSPALPLARQERTKRRTKKKSSCKPTAGTLSPAEVYPVLPEPCGKHEAFLTPKPPRLSARPPKIAERSAKTPWFRPAAARSEPLWVGGCLGSGEGERCGAAPQNLSCPRPHHMLGPKRAQSQHQKQPRSNVSPAQDPGTYCSAPHHDPKGHQPPTKPRCLPSPRRGTEPP